MAANLLVRRSTAGLLRLVRSQAATFTTERPPPSNPSCTCGRAVTLGIPDFRQLLKTRDVDVAEKAISGLEKYCKKYNLVKDTRSIDEILDSDKGFQKFLRHIERSKASAILWSYWRSLVGFGEQMISFLFWEHLVKHCSHAKIHMDEVLKFKEAFSLPFTEILDSKAKRYFDRTVYYKKPPPQILKDWLLAKNEENKKETRTRAKYNISRVVMREIEEDIMKIYREITAKCDPDGKSTEM